MDGLAMRVLRAEDALPGPTPKDTDNEALETPYTGASFRDILALSACGGDPSAPEFIESRGGQSYFSDNPLQLVRLVRLLEVDRATADRIVKLRFPEAFEKHKAAINAREELLANAQLVVHHPEMARIWKDSNFGTSVEAKQLFSALKAHLVKSGVTGTLVEDDVFETRYADSFPAVDGPIFVADLNSFFQPEPEASLASWILFNAHRQEAMDIAWLQLCRTIQSEIAAMSVIPDANQRRRHVLGERVRLVMKQASLIPSSPSLDPGPVTALDARGAVRIAAELMWSEPTGDVVGWRKLYALLVRVKEYLEMSAKPLTAVIRSMWTPMAFPSEMDVELSEAFVGVGGVLAEPFAAVGDDMGQEVRTGEQVTGGETAAAGAEATEENGGKDETGQKEDAGTGQVEPTTSTTTNLVAEP
ncbi:hypothetical protein HK104_007361, partial [Borealophlyctis nickersoniae]